ncbi:MAG: hypothetical protein SLAVMIC_00034 [uncultured marine phage]|uniref:Uncharacterized protein n=1 Tax=uncultured marine phage TaxID=707152 RepID=A0A8D9C891_9VIRU|nr:MAG: hypothetical protein SLAVMIC_00034 [uncultured marine phage]
MDYITSKTHRYISVRQFPSDYIIKKFHNHEPKAIKQFHDCAKMYNDFYRSFVEFVTNNEYNYYIREYMFGSREAIQEEIHELTGIKVAEAGNNIIYCIPRTDENDPIYNWIIDNVPCKYKILKRTRGTFMDHGVSTYWRDNNRTPNDLKEKLNQ